jgi:hypothetical protein
VLGLDPWIEEFLLYRYQEVNGEGILSALLLRSFTEDNTKPD